MARPILSETIVADDHAVIGGDLISGAMRVDNPDCDRIEFALQFDPLDIRDPALVASWMLQERKEGKPGFANVFEKRGSAVGAPDNDLDPSLLILENPVVTTSPPKRRYSLSDLRLIYNLAGREGGVTVQITARQLGADDGT